ncbi:2-oxo-4-hydroxy-4-carboxy-5-ureidoimidazoline decarboxylase [Streptomyces sp. NPDC017979]|uniref:2-oxo-4-hydroxy-4-carboxy-5-ureidoimidazoline decarboxylase n=1 Tax=Streptomyces sp. NPDC017979 TaxID=3365024 RepID=UPI003793EAA6
MSQQPTAFPSSRGEEPTLSSDSDAGLPHPARPSHLALPAQTTASPAGPTAVPKPLGPADAPQQPGLTLFNSATDEDALAALLACCGSARWAERVAAHRPYPDVGSLLAAADEAGYDLAPADLSEALADEYPAGPHPDAPQGTHVARALDAAHAAYESRFGHSFVLHLDAYAPEEWVDEILIGIRLRLNHEPDQERVVSAEQLRLLARARLRQTVAGPRAATTAPWPGARTAR